MVRQLVMQTQQQEQQTTINILAIKQMKTAYLEGPDLERIQRQRDCFVQIGCSLSMASNETKEMFSQLGMQTQQQEEQTTIK